MADSHVRIGSSMRKQQWCALLVCIGLSVLPAGPSSAQVETTSTSPREAVLLWHEAKALFPIRVHLPPDHDPTRAYPAVITLHGYGGSSESGGHIDRAFAEAGFIVVRPEGPYPVFSDDSARHATWELSTWLAEIGLEGGLNDDPEIERRSGQLTTHSFLPSVIDQVEQQYRIGPLYLFGFSLGGVYALGGGFFNHQRIDGIVAFGVGYFEEEWFTRYGDDFSAANHLPIRLVQGRSDPLVPFSHAERARDLLKKGGYEVVLDEFEGGHTVPEDALERAVGWLRELTKEK